MAGNLAEFLRTVGPEFDGKAQLILDTTGAVDLEELLDLVDSREDLRDLDREDVGMKALHVKKLFRAIMQAKETGARSGSFTAPRTPPASPQEPMEAETKAAPPQVFPKLEKLMSTLPEDSVKEPSYYVACSDASKHTEMPPPEEAETGGYPRATKEAVPMPDPMKRGPLLFSKTAGSSSTASLTAEQKKYKAKAKDFTKDFPTLGSAGQEPEVTRLARSSGSGAAAAERAMQAAELARLAAQQAEHAAAEAAKAEGSSATRANAALAQRMLRERREAYRLRKEAYDRVVEFFWDAHTFKFVGGRAQHGVPSPISALTEEELQAAFTEGLKVFCQANQPEGGLAWETPEIEEWILYEPNPVKSKKGKEMRPHVLVMFKSLEDVQYIEHIYQLRMQSEDASKIPVMKINGQALSVQRPNPEYVQRVESSKGSETASQVGSVAGSENSHSSTTPSEYRNLTLLFMNLPEAVYASLSQRPAARQAIEAYVAKVLDGPPALPVARDAIKFSASFSEPKKAPYCGCWLTFRYTVEKKRINPDDGKAYTLEALKNLYKDKKKEVAILKLWERGVDAAFEVEKTLAGGGGKRPVSIARWFMDRIQEKKVPAPHPFEKDNFTWTECQVGGNALSVQFKRWS